MKRAIAALALIAAVLSTDDVWAHRIEEYLQATLLSLQADRVDASMRLIPGVQVAPALIAEIDSDGDGLLSNDEQRAYAQRVLTDVSITSDGTPIAPKLIFWRFPTPQQMREGLGEIELRYSAPLPGSGDARTLLLENHHKSDISVYLVNVLVPEDSNLNIVSQKRDAQQSRYELDYRQNLTRAGAGTKINPDQFHSVFTLGMRHIAEGTDHLLFLLVLLLPAPLLVRGARWSAPASVGRSLRRILGIVTAFTVGHSITLSLAVTGMVRLPERPVEVLIAASVLVSAAHAVRPLFPGREAGTAAAFGLIHGLAFASVLERLGLTHESLALGILAFNLGIEAMQLIVVAAVLPTLILMSRTRQYSFLRVGIAVIAGSAATAWLLERLLNFQTPVDAILGGMMQHRWLIASTAFLISLACRFLTAADNHQVAADARHTDLAGRFRWRNS